MDSRGERFACGTLEGTDRQTRETAGQLRDEGRPEINTGREGPSDFRRPGVAPLAVKTVDRVARRPPDHRLSDRWQTSAEPAAFAEVSEPSGGQAPASDPLHQLSDAAAAEMALLDARGVVVSVNAAWRAAATECSPVGVGLGRSYVNVCRWLDPELDLQTLRKAMDELLSGASQSFIYTCERGGPTGRCWRQIRIARMRVADDVHFVAIHEDLNEVARAQAALRETAIQLLSAQEDERRRIAVELHDSTSQHLVALALGLTSLKSLAGKGDHAERVLEDMSKSLQEAVKEIRVLSYLMTPSFGREGLEAQARRFVSGFGARTGLHTDFGVKGVLDDLGPDVQHTLFRIIQEALANVYKHAAARSVTVELRRGRCSLRVRIVDDGTGIAALKTGTIEDVPMGVGIAGMRARMAQLGGDLRIKSSDKGTIVVGALPTLPPAPVRPHRRRGLDRAAVASGFGAT
jgi:signal transduction histidine kinase